MAACVALVPLPAAFFACGATDRPSSRPTPAEAAGGEGAAAATGAGSPPIGEARGHISFGQAKDRLADMYLEHHREELYCGCAIADDFTSDRTACGYVPRNEGERAPRLEWDT